MCERFDIGNVR